LRQWRISAANRRTGSEIAGIFTNGRLLLPKSHGAHTIECARLHPEEWKMTMLKITKTETDFTSSVSVVNGTDAVHALIESVEAQPAQGMTHWRVASAWQGGARSLAQVDGFMIGAPICAAPRTG
jgi:hypothetical protein